MSILTETWLTSKENWLELTTLNHDPHKIFIQNRSKGKGGGLTLNTKHHYEVNKIEGGNKRSFEYFTWNVKIRGKPITISLSTIHPTQK